MTFYTDYPMLALGDKSGEKAPIREIELKTWDADKYVGVQVVGTDHQEEIKWGYIYTTPRRLEDGDFDRIANEGAEVYSALRGLPTSY